MTFFSLVRKSVLLFVRHRKLFLQIISLSKTHGLFPLPTQFLFYILFLSILWPQTWPAGLDGSSWHLFYFGKIKHAIGLFCTWTCEATVNKRDRSNYVGDVDTKTKYSGNYLAKDSPKHVLIIRCKRMANLFKRRGTGILTAVFAFIAFVMIVAALLSEYWVMADLERQVGNSTQKGGSKHFGMFNGVSKQDFGLGARERDFAGENRIIFVLQNVVYPKIKIYEAYC